MEALLDHLAGYLATNSLTSVVTWILGDPGMGNPPGLPFAYIAPFNDQPKMYSGGGLSGGQRGVDMDVYTIPMVIVQDLHQYDAPVPSATPPVLEQPGYRALLQLAQAVRQALRQNITLDGTCATSTVTEMRYVLVTIDNKEYRGCRITLSVSQRRPRN